MFGGVSDGDAWEDFAIGGGAGNEVCQNDCKDGLGKDVCVSHEGVDDRIRGYGSLGREVELAMKIVETC